MHTLPKSSSGSSAVPLAILLLTFVVGLFPFTADYVLFHPDERHYADAGIRMLQSGDYLTPRTSDGRLRLKKPILPYWCVAAGYHTVGVSPLGARLGFLLAGAGVVALSWWGALIAFDSRRAACFAAVAAASQPALLISAPRSVPDVCLALAIQLSVCGFLLIQRRQKTTCGALAAAFGGAALAVLCKGLPAVAFLGVALVLSAWQSPALFRRDWWRWGLAATICLMLAGSWFVVMGQLHSDELALQFLRDQLGRNRFAVTPLQALIQFPLCLALLLAMSAPWLLSVLPELRIAEWRAQIAKRPAVLLILGWALVYCALAGMINHVTLRYLLPVAAPLSIVIGGLLHQVDPELLRRRLNRVLLVVGAVAALGILVTGLNVPAPKIRALSIAAVVARACQHGDPPALERPQEHPRFLRDREACLFHQLRLAHARGDSRGLQFAHLRGGHQFHRSPFSRISWSAFSPRRGVSSISVIARSPITEAIAMSSRCVIEISSPRSSMSSARFAPRPYRNTSGFPRRFGSTSMSFQPTPRMPVPSAFITASFAANRAASSCTRPRQCAISSGVYTRFRKRSPCLASTSATRCISMTSMPCANLRGLVESLVISR